MCRSSWASSSASSLRSWRRGRQDAGDLLALDQLLEPPVGVVLGAEVLDRLAGAGQVVEVAALHGLLDLQVDPLACWCWIRCAAAAALRAGAVVAAPVIGQAAARVARAGPVSAGARYDMVFTRPSQAGRASGRRRPATGGGIRSSAGRGEQGGHGADRPDGEVAAAAAPGPWSGPRASRCWTARSRRSRRRWRRPRSWSRWSCRSRSRCGRAARRRRPLAGSAATRAPEPRPAIAMLTRAWSVVSWKGSHSA